MCEELERRLRQDQLKARRVDREGQVAAALTTRANTMAAGKVRWDDKHPTVNKLAKTVVIKTLQISKLASAQVAAKSKARKAWKGAKIGNLVKVQQTEEIRADKSQKFEQEKGKGKQKLQIQKR